MTPLLADLRHALRSLRKAPLFTTVAVLSIAFGLAANTAVFTLVDQIILRRLPVAKPAELVQLHARGSEWYGGGFGDTELSYAMYRDLRDRNTVFAGVFCRMSASLHVGHDGRTEQVVGELVSGNFFTELGVRPAAGRLITPTDDRVPGGHPIAVLSFAYWRSRFAADPAIVGRTIRVNGHPLEVIGVVDPAFRGFDIGRPAQVYVPVTMQPKMGPAWLQLEGRRFRWVQVYARLRPGITLAAAEAGIQPFYQSLLEQEATESAFDSASAETRTRFLEGRLTIEDASRGRSFLQESLEDPLLILMAIAGMVLVIVCANVANLLITRGAARRRELALRLAVGAAPWQITRYLLVESLVIAMAGAAVGLLLANWGAGVLLGYFAPSDTPRAIAAAPDLRIVLFTTGLALVTAAASGILPALRSRRLDVSTSLKGSGGGVVNEQLRLRKALIVAQVALSLVLLIGAGLFLRSLNNLMAIDPGFRTERMLAFSFDLSASGYDAERADVFMRTLLDRLPRTPGVSDAAIAFLSVLGGGRWDMGFTVEGHQPPPGEDSQARVNAVTPGFFKTMGIPLLAGRDFTLEDGRARARTDGWPYTVAVVDETFVKRYLKGGNPIGRRIGLGDDPGTETPIEIVGVVRSSHYSAVREDPFPTVYLASLQAALEFATAYVRTEQDPYVVMQGIRRELAAMDSQVALYGVTTLEERVAQSIVNERMIASLSTTLAIMATLLAIMGLYGVMAYSVTRRTREIGIRMAIGARTRQIAAGVLREASVMIALGLALGLLASWSLGRYIGSQLYGVAPVELTATAGAMVTLMSVATLAALVPARRAARVSPMAALRED